MNQHWVKCNGSQAFTGLLGLALLCLIWHSACSLTPVTSRILFDQDLRLVRLDVTYRTGQREYAHPAKRSPAEWAATLQHLEAVPLGRFPFTLGGQAIATPAFSSTHITWLAPLLSQALNRATPLETAVFFFVEQGDHGLPEITSGGVYAQEHTIHLLFANYRHATAGQAEIRQSRNNPMKSLGEPLYAIRPGPHGSIATTDTWGSVMGSRLQHLVMDDQKGEPPPGTIPEPKTLPISKTMDTGFPTTPSHHNTLQMLRKLRQRGILTEEEFQEKTRQLKSKP